jgi:hypothetical protein
MLLSMALSSLLSMLLFGGSTEDEIGPYDEVVPPSVDSNSNGVCCLGTAAAAAAARAEILSSVDDIMSF